MAAAVELAATTSVDLCDDANGLAQSAKIGDRRMRPYLKREQILGSVGRLTSVLWPRAAHDQENKKPASKQSLTGAPAQCDEWFISAI